MNPSKENLEAAHIIYYRDICDCHGEDASNEAVKIIAQALQEKDDAARGLVEALKGMLEYMEPDDGPDDDGTGGCYACFGHWDEEGDHFIHDDCDFQGVRDALAKFEQARNG